MREPSRRIVLTVVAFGVFVAADDLTVVATTLRDIIGDLHISLPDGLDDAAWIVNAYLVAYVAAMPIMGRLADVIGRRTTFVAALALFAAGSLMLPHTTTLGWFTVGRVITAIGGAAMVPIALAVTADLYHGPQRTRALGLLGALDVLGWVWGPLFGAFIVRYLDWRWQFHVNVPLSLMGMAAAWWALREVDRGRTRERLDLGGALALSGGLVLLTMALLDSTDITIAEGFEDLSGGSGVPVVPFLVGAAALLALFTAIELRHPSPVIDIRSFRNGPYARTLVATFVVGGILVIAMVDVPLFVNLVLEPDLKAAAVRSGLILSALTLAMAASTWLGARAATWLGHTPVIVTGLLTAAAAFWVMAVTWDQSVATTPMAVHLAFLGAGLGATTAPLHDRAVADAGPERRGAAGSMVVLARLLGLTIGLSGLTAWAIHRYDVLRSTLVLPPITDPGYEAAATEAQAGISAEALATTFAAAAAAAVFGAVVVGVRRRRTLAASR